MQSTGAMTNAAAGIAKKKVSLAAPCKAFWDFVAFVAYQGDQTMALLRRIANRYTFSELQMFKGMYEFYYNSLHEKFGRGTDGDSDKISSIIAQGPDLTQYYLQADPTEAADEFREVEELENLAYVFHAFDPVMMLYDGVKKPLLPTKAFHSPPFIAELVKGGAKIANIGSDFEGFEVQEELGCEE
jgi:hypothetical protein